jgi:DNA-binding NtrC family response regulator
MRQNVDLDHGTILIVDDEEIVLKSIKNFLALETEWTILEYRSPVEALNALPEKTVDVVVSDYLMPEMNGIDFLLKVKDIRPLTTRIMLTAYADKENAIRAINEVGLFQYIEKPWDNEELKLIIRNGLERRVLLEQLDETIHDFETSQTKLQNIHNRILKAFV